MIPATAAEWLAGGETFLQPAADALDGLIGFGEEPGEGVPAMWHVVPDLEGDVDTRGAGPGGKPGGVVEEYLGVADVDEDRREITQIGVDR